MELKHKFFSDLKPQKAYLLLFVILFLLTRLLSVGFEEINPDTVNWYYRSQQFVVGLKTLDLAKTYQHYHPGVTLMWVMGIATEITKQVGTFGSLITSENFLAFHVINKIFLVFFQLAISLAVIYFLSRFLGVTKSIIIVGLFSLEPFFIGNSRFLHLDVLLSLFIFLTLTVSYLNYIHLEKPKTSLSILVGILVGLSFLSKSIGISVLPVVVLMVLIGKKGSNFKHLLVTLAALLVSLPIIFPALITNYTGVILDIFKEAMRIGARNGHEQVFLGEETVDAGFWFYFITLFIKTSPLLLISFISGVVVFIKSKKNPESRFYYITSLYYVGYFLVMSLLSKKIDRYMLTMFPFFALFGVYAFYYFYPAQNFRSKLFGVVFSLAVMLNLYSYITLFPYYFVYFNPLVGGSKNANSLIAQKPFGQGVVWLRNEILNKYGDYPAIGIYDRKPLSMIYKNSRLYDVREYDSTKYDILVLGVNEEIPEKVLDGNVQFRLAETLVINNLDYWRVYVRQ